MANPAQARMKQFLFVHLWYAPKMNQKARKGLAPLTPSDPRAERGARVPNYAIRV